MRQRATCKPGWRSLIAFGLALGLVGLASDRAMAQQGGSVYGAMRSRPQPTAAMRYFAGQRPLETPRQQVRQAVPPPQPVQWQGMKPFEDVNQDPTLSPYLTLDFVESGTGVPNYYGFTRPMVEQRESNEAQARELRRLKQQLRVATSRGIVSKNPSGGMPTTGQSSQFQNLGSYYPGLR